MGRLTTARAKALSKQGMYHADVTLYLNIARGGSKSWIQRITIEGKRRDIGLGPFPVIGLAEARRRAFENRVEVASGRDPLADKRRTKVPTFREAAERTFEANRPRWRNAKTAKNWEQGMARYAHPAIGNMYIDQVNREDVLRILTPIWTEKPEMARKLRQRMRAVFAWCQAHGFMEHNPAGEAIGGALPAMPAVKANYRALPYREVPEALRIVDGSRASLAVKLALRFVILTAGRSGEVRLATWDEIDVDNAVWKVPAERMKAAREHRVPLSATALEVLKDTKAIRDSSNLVFPSPVRRGQPMSDMTLIKALRDSGLADRATVHGFRSSFRDWCAETGKPREIAEAALAHVVGGVEGAYFRSDLFARRRHLMDQWAAFLTGDSADVVKLHG